MLFYQENQHYYIFVKETKLQQTNLKSSHLLHRDSLLQYWQGFQISCVQFHLFSPPCAGGRQSTSEMWSRVNGLWRGELKWGPSSYTYSTCFKYKKRAVLEEALKVERSSSFSCHSQTSHHSAAGDQRKGSTEMSELEVWFCHWVKTSHLNAGAIWGSLYKAVVSDWSLFQSPDRKAGPWGWLWWCAVA